jgi:hypothetical protein
MVWRVARSLDQLLAQLNALAPNRSRVSDGSIGDAGHQAQGSASDHNPWYLGEVVTARDFTHDPAGGLDCNKLAAALTASRDLRIKYIIWQGRIWDSRQEFNPGTWQPSSGHYQHLHLSVMANALADDPRPWSLPGLTPEEDDMPTAEEVANAVWNRSVAVVEGANPDGSLRTHAANAVDVLRYSELHHNITWGRINDVAKAVVALGQTLGAQITALGIELGDDERKLLAAIAELPDGAPGGGPSPAEIVAAVREVFADAGDGSDNPEGA